MSNADQLGDIYAEAHRRSLEAMTDFQLVDQAVSALADRNTLRLPVPEVEKGSVVCVGEALLIAEDEAPAPPDSLQVTHDDQLRHLRQIPVHRVVGRYAALWPDAEEAALYDVSADFTPNPLEASKPFRPLAESILGSSGFPGLSVLEKSFNATVYMPKAIDLPLLPVRSVEVTTSEDTRLAAKKDGFPDYYKKTHAWQLQISGDVGIKFPVGRFTRVDNKSVQTSSSPSDNPLAIDIPSGRCTLEYHAPMNAVVAVNPDGYFTVQEPDGEPQKVDLRLSVRDAYMLARNELSWHDVTESFLEKHRDKLLEAVPVSGRDESIRDCARIVVEQALAVTSIEPRTVGCLAVLRELDEGLGVVGVPYR